MGPHLVTINKLCQKNEVKMLMRTIVTVHIAGERRVPSCSAKTGNTASTTRSASGASASIVLSSSPSGTPTSTTSCAWRRGRRHGCIRRGTRGGGIRFISTSLPPLLGLLLFGSKTRACATRKELVNCTCVFLWQLFSENEQSSILSQNDKNSNAWMSGIVDF